MGEIREDQKSIIIFSADSEIKEIECTIKNVYSDRISFTLPRGTMSFAKYLDEGQEIGVKVFTPSGVRMFSSMILDSPLEPEFTVEYVEENIQVQRRAFSRTYVETRLVIKKSNGEEIKANTIDISGGSVKFKYNGNFVPEQILNIDLYLKHDALPIPIQAKIIDTPSLPDDTHVCLFEKIAEADRDKIIKKCFEIEASIYKKE